MSVRICDNGIAIIISFNVIIKDVYGKNNLVNTAVRAYVINISCLMIGMEIEPIIVRRARFACNIFNCITCN